MSTLTADHRKGERYRAHHWLSTRSVRRGAATCMHALDGAGAVNVGRTAGGAVHVSGVQRCASVWACPVCAPTIRERRATEVDAAVSAALVQGLHVYFVTATVSHKLGDHLADVLNLVTDSWRATFSGRAAQTLKQSGYIGQVRNIEVTHGSNGWHPHIHALLFFDRPADHLVQSIGSRYTTAVASRGGVSLFPGPGWDYSSCKSADAVSSYLAKVEGGWGVGLEMARGDVKLANGGKGRTPFQLLRDAVAGDVDAAILFRIYEQATVGRNFMRWSRCLKARFGIDEVTEDEAAEAAPDDVLTHEWSIPVELWRSMVRAGQLGSVLIRAQTCPTHVCIVTGELLVSTG